jgi:exopolysaccharide production protein ExoZ
MPTLVSVQYLRAFAAASVIVYHTLLSVLAIGPEEPFSIYGLAFGADIFFVISGFIMWTATQGSRSGPRRFLKARFVRVVPFYWLALAVYLGVIFVQGGYTFSGFPRLDEIVKAYLFIPYIDSHTGLNSPYYTLGWTLNHEMFFYAVFACALLCRSDVLRFGFVMALFALLVLMRPVVDASDPVLFRLTSPLMLEFFAGMAIAFARQRRLVPPRQAAILALILAFAFMILVSSSHADHWPRVVYFGVPATLIVLGVVSLEDWLSRRPARPLLLLGDASYSLYLSHDIVLKLIFVYGAGFAVSHAVIAFAAILAVELALGVICHRRLERPLLDRLQRGLVLRRGSLQGSGAGAGGPIACRSGMKAERGVDEERLGAAAHRSGRRAEPTFLERPHHSGPSIAARTVFVEAAPKPPA